MNTIHFKGPWEIPFDPQETHNAPFHVNPNEKIPVAMMTSEGRYSFGDLQELNSTAVVIPYKVGRPVQQDMQVYDTMTIAASLSSANRGTASAC